MSIRRVDNLDPAGDAMDRATLAHARYMPGDIRISGDTTGVDSKVEVYANDSWHYLNTLSVTLDIVGGLGAVATIKINNPHVELSTMSKKD